MAKNTLQQLQVPSVHNWRTTDADEINRRRDRARTEEFRIFNEEPQHPIFSNFKVSSSSGMSYKVEIRDVQNRQFACECVDFRINGLGTCKHVEAVLQHLEGRYRKLFRTAARNGSTRLDIVPDLAGGILKLICHGAPVPRSLRSWFKDDGSQCDGTPQETLSALDRLRSASLPELRFSQELAMWMENTQRAAERKAVRQEYEQKVQSGEWPAQETKVPLFPYQREGMLHLAFTERALLADEMGLGKTIQAIAACSLVQRLGRAARALVVTRHRSKRNGKSKSSDLRIWDISLYSVVVLRG